MLKIPMETWFSFQKKLFQKTLEYQNVISICYKWHQILHLFSKMPTFQTWAIAQTITYTLHAIVKLCILNQSQGY
jgi:hypothetical protein